MRPKSDGTTLDMQHIVCDYVIARFGQEIAEGLKPLDIQRWLKSLHTERKLVSANVSKVHGAMCGFSRRTCSSSWCLGTPASRRKRERRLTTVSSWSRHSRRSPSFAPLPSLCIATWCLPARQRLRAAAFGVGASSEGLTFAYALREGHGFRVSVLEGARQGAIRRRRIRRGPSAQGGESGRSADPGRPSLWAAQSPAFTFHMDGEQGEDRAQDGAGHPRTKMMQ